jgi:hypothetical protein
MKIMERLKLFFDKNIIELLIILFSIYIIFYILKVNLHLIVTLIVFAIILYYKFKTRENEKMTILANTKNDKFQNKIPTILQKYDDIINFLYYISDFKQYNEQVYAELLVNLNDFLTLYEDYQIIKGTKKKLMEDVINDTKHKTLDNLSSFIYSFNNSPVLREKLNNSIEKLNKILNNYINNLGIKIDHITGANNFNY